jgi:hypothetical protein
MQERAATKEKGLTKQRISIPALGFLIVLGPGIAAARADWVELSNNDIVRGQVVSLDGQKVKLKSANFGEMTIPRDKVKVIGFGERPLATTPQAVGQGLDQLGSQLPSLLGNGQLNLGNGQLGQLLQQALGGGDLHETIDKTKNDLKKLQKDLKSTPEAGALDSYIQMFDLLGKLTPRSSPPAAAPKSSTAKPQPQDPGKR